MNSRIKEIERKEKEIGETGSVRDERGMQKGE